MKNILITGSTGKTGRRIAQRLRATGHPVRTASRGGSDVHFDLGDPATWAPALDGVSAAYLVEPEPGSGARIPGLVTAAVEAGVRRLVFLSAHGIGDAPDGNPLKIAERAVQDSGVDWTILRPDWFSQNFSESFWLQAVLEGTLALPTGEGRAPFIDADDIAEVGAAALTEDRHAGQIYPLTGPRAIGFGEAVGLIGAATGRTIRYVDVDPEAFVESQLAAGVPAGAARLLANLYVGIRDQVGEPILSDGVKRALGRVPKSFEDFVTDAATAGSWRRD